MSKHYRNYFESLEDLTMQQQMAELESDSDEEMSIKNIGENTDKEVGVRAKRRRRDAKVAKVNHPLMCRACGKIFTDTSNCRRHEKNHLCSRSKPSYKVKLCIANNF